MPYTSGEVRLAARPAGEPQPADFELAEVEIADPADGELVVRNTFMSVDPYMRGRMNDAQSYVPPFQLGEPLSGGAVGEVVASRAEGLEAGDVVLHDLGWREYAVLRARPRTQSRRDAGAAVGLPRACSACRASRPTSGCSTSPRCATATSCSSPPRPARSARSPARSPSSAATCVIGSAGSAEKVAHLRDELGFDAAFDYHDGPVARQLREAAPGRHRRLLRQRRRRPPRGRARRAAPPRPRRAVRGDLELQRRRRSRARATSRWRSASGSTCAGSSSRPCGPLPGVPAGGRRVGPRGPRQVPRDDRRRRRRGARRRPSSTCCAAPTSAR